MMRYVALILLLALNVAHAQVDADDCPRGEGSAVGHAFCRRRLEIGRSLFEPSLLIAMFI